MLAKLLTDYWAGKGTQALANLLPNRVTKSLDARCHTFIPNNLVHSWNKSAIAWDLQVKGMTKIGGTKARYLGYCRVGKKFSVAAIQEIHAIKHLPEQSVYFGYDTCGLEVMRYLKKRGVACVLDQIDPCRVEVDMVRAEQEAWPGWQNYDLEVPDEFYERHLAEWELADRIVVNSNFSRDALITQGVDRRKMVVVPLCYEPDRLAAVDELSAGGGKDRITTKEFSAKQPLHVLFLGQVMLRKGVQYLIEAAKKLINCPVVFDVVGPVYISDLAIKSAPENVRFHGRVARSEIGKWYRNSDIFILPTISDGFAITQLEAMSYGLPVIATVNCGEVVSDGMDGFIVPVRDPEAIARTIAQYLEMPDCLGNHREEALRKSRMFSISRIGDALEALGKDIYGHADSGAYSA